MMIGAHPDDCEYHAGGLAVKYRRLGHAVKFVSLTNGDAGHHETGGAELARRRREEARLVADAYGIEYEVLDIPDGRLTADLATREHVIRLIRRYKPDLVFTHRPNDYHPDHRATGVLVQDASYLIRVPNICSDTPLPDHIPIILLIQDGFTKPAPFQPDIAVAIDDAIEEKARMLHFHQSQFYEWLPFVGGYADEVPEGDEARLAWTGERVKARDLAAAERFHDALRERYGAAGDGVRYAEAFEVSEYGRPLPQGEIERWFPR